MMSYSSKIVLLRCAATAVLLLAAPTACRQVKPVAQVAGVRIDVSDAVIAAAKVDTFKIGNVRNGEKILKEFALHNSGNKPFVLNAVKSDCGCVASQFDHQPVMPDHATPVSISFDSRGYHGFVFKRVEIFTSLDPKPLTLWISAVVE